MTMTRATAPPTTNKGEEKPTKRLKKTSTQPSTESSVSGLGERLKVVQASIDAGKANHSKEKALKDRPSTLHKEKENNAGTSPKPTNIEFIVKCQNDEQITVSPSEAATLKAKCEFFRNSFRHGTEESHSGILSKPDWTKETADNIVSLLVEGHCEIPLQYDSLQKAAAQVLIPIRVRHPLDGHDISSDTKTVQDLSDRWVKCKSKFALETPLEIDGNKWKDLLDCGVVIIRDEKKLVVEAKKATTDKGDIFLKNYQGQTLLVGASTPLCVSVYHTCYSLSAAKNSEPPVRDERNVDQVFLLAFRAHLGAGVYLQQVLGKKVKFCKGQGFEKIYYGASAKDLLQVLGHIEDFILPPKICMLWADKPNSWALGQLIRAVQLCDDNPGTLAWNVDEYSFSAVKTISDIRNMLTILSNPSTPAAVSGSVHVRDQAVATWAAF